MSHYGRLEVELSGPAQGLQRSRQSAKGKRFDSETNTKNKKRIAHAFREDAYARDIKLPISAGKHGYEVEIFVYVAFPARMNEHDRALANTCELRPMKTPDVDNVAKLYLDALVQGNIIEDDRCVTSLRVHRLYSDTDFVYCALLYNEDEEEKDED